MSGLESKLQQTKICALRSLPRCAAQVGARRVRYELLLVVVSPYCGGCARGTLKRNFHARGDVLSVLMQFLRSRARAYFAGYLRECCACRSRAFFPSSRRKKSRAVAPREAYFLLTRGDEGASCGDVGYDDDDDDDAGTLSCREL